MVKKLGLLCVVLAVFTMPALAAPVIGEAAPEIEAVDVRGDTFKLSDHKGKIVVLEWTNHQCPFVVKHYDSGNMQDIQKAARADGAEWVTIISSAPGHQGHVSDDEALAIAADKNADPTTIIRDETGEIGGKYEAKTTPHMFVIDADGILVYAGAIDSNPSPRASTIEGATNYVTEALAALKNGEPVVVSEMQPYGCGVKYAK